MKKKTLIFSIAVMVVLVLGFVFLQNEKTFSPEESFSMEIETETEITQEPASEATETIIEAEKQEVQEAEAPKTEATEAKPKPEAKEVAPESEKLTANTCFVSVRCDTILNNKDLLPKEKWELVPTDGKILAMREVEFSPSESAFDILYRVLRDEKIHIEFTENAAFNSVYIEGIANIYEMDCGKLSGWMYMVNGAVPSIGSSSYQPSVGDKIEWVYTCGAGRDLSNGKGIE